MSEIVKIVAKALCCRHGCEAAGATYDPIRGSVSICQAHTYQDDARAAIAAMREPTELSLRAAGEAFLDATIAHEAGDKPNTPFVRFWRAMIDAALSYPSQKG